MKTFEHRLRTYDDFLKTNNDTNKMELNRKTERKVRTKHRIRLIQASPLSFVSLLQRQIRARLTRLFSILNNNIRRGAVFVQCALYFYSRDQGLAYVCRR